MSHNRTEIFKGELKIIIIIFKKLSDCVSFFFYFFLCGIQNLRIVTKPTLTMRLSPWRSWTLQARWDKLSTEYQFHSACFVHLHLFEKKTFRYLTLKNIWPWPCLINSDHNNVWLDNCSSILANQNRSLAWLKPGPECFFKTSRSFYYCIWALLFLWSPDYTIWTHDDRKPVFLS